MAGYFDNFGIVQYSNSFCRNIISRASISIEAIKNTSVFYPYEVKQGERPDVISHLYYDIPNADWLIYFSNGIIDPYYDFYLSDNQLTQYMTLKYGSLARAQTKISHYRINWDTDSSRKTISAYESLPGSHVSNHKKYWRPVVDNMDRTIYYVRKESDATVETNKIVSLSVVNDPTNSGLLVGEDLFQQSGIGYIARAEIVKLTPNKIFVKNVYGEFNPGVAVTSSETDKTIQIASVQDEVVNIPDEEVIYWSPVSFYDHEVFLNEKKKSLNLVDRDYLELAEKNLRTIMK